jgi:hypothetical protein
MAHQAVDLVSRNALTSGLRCETLSKSLKRTYSGEFRSICVHIVARGLCRLVRSVQVDVHSSPGFGETPRRDCRNHRV